MGSIKVRLTKDWEGTIYKAGANVYVDAKTANKLTRGKKKVGLKVKNNEESILDQHHEEQVQQ